MDSPRACERAGEKVLPREGPAAFCRTAARKQDTGSNSAVLTRLIPYDVASTESRFCTGLRHAGKRDPEIAADVRQLRL